MDGRVFFDRVVAHDGIEWLGVNPASDEVHVGHGRTGTSFALSVDAILSREWDELEAVLTGKRRPRVLTHLTRIVGYYSQVHNWNRSKHAELRDRQSGSYAVAEVPVREPARAQSAAAA